MPPRGGALAVVAVVLAGCGGSRASRTVVSTVPAGTRLLSGCHSLPFSGGSFAATVAIYRITTTPDSICFMRLGAGQYAGPAGLPRNYGDPIINSDEPRSGVYMTTYYSGPRRYWLLDPVACPCS
jgi:hypothetical protein